MDAQRAVDVLEQRFPAVSGTSAQVVFAVDSGSLADPAAAATVEAAVADIAAHPDVTGVGELQTSPRRARSRYVDVQYDRPVGEIRDEAFAAPRGDGAHRLRRTACRSSSAASCRRRRSTSRRVARRSSASSPPIIVLLIAFGSVIAMGLPIGTALFGLAAGLGLITLHLRRSSTSRRRHRAGDDDRPRRRHRLRAVHRHPPPREPAPRHDRRGAGRAGHRDLRVGRALRRHHRRDRHLRPRHRRHPHRHRRWA